MKATVVVGYDGTPHSKRALTQAGREAVWRGAAIKVVHVLQWFEAGSPQACVPLETEETIAGQARRIAASGADILRLRHRAGPGPLRLARTVPGGTRPSCPGIEGVPSGPIGPGGTRSFAPAHTRACRHSVAVEGVFAMYGTFPGPVPQPPPEPGPQNTPKPIAGHREHHLLPGVQPTWNLRLESTGGHIPARFLVESPLAATLVTEDLCWQAATEDWKNRRPRRWRPRARAAWQAEGDELASEAVRLQEMADYVFREL